MRPRSWPDERAGGGAGCTGSHFTNVTGLHDPNQVMTARDTVKSPVMRRIISALRNMMELSTYSVNPVSKGSPRSWPASNELVRSVSPLLQRQCCVRTQRICRRPVLGRGRKGSKAGYEYMAVALGAPKPGDGTRRASTNV